MYIKEYSEYLRDHIDEVAEAVDIEAERRIPQIREFVLSYLDDVFSEEYPIHYEIKYGGCSYDHSGRIVEKGIIDASKSIGDFFDTEYTGCKIATHCSHCGWQYDTFADRIQEDIEEIISDIIITGVRNTINSAFNCTISDADLLDVRTHCDIFDVDDIEDNTDMHDWLTHISGILEKLELINTPLSEIVGSDRKSVIQKHSS